MKKKDISTEETIEKISPKDGGPIEYQEGDTCTTVVDGKEVIEVYHNGEWVSDTTDEESEEDDEEETVYPEAPSESDENNNKEDETSYCHSGFDGFAAVADLLNNKGAVSDQYTNLFKTTLDLFEANDDAHEGINQSISFIAENIDNLISQLNKYKKNTEMKLRLLFLVSAAAWIALIVKVL